ncbi:hypothetical protein AVEN_75594-1 [Araneus ventricosus]|uniref:DUF19 domain-containing protein n=1 Tax=Araneus ventricosus TaxID=182803 RepID=A0A4Y2CJU0_ARAVE|nr:hypothetical protein AVEN_75594-1 [Araneus ventricosus]
MAFAFVSFVVLSLAIQGCLGDDASMSFFQKFCNDAENCADYELGQRLKEIDYLPTTERELNTFCPSITKLMWCVVQECAGKNIFCSNSPSNRTGNSMISALNVGSIVLEICTYGSDLRQKYLYDVSCIKGIMFRNGKSNNKCVLEGYSIMLSAQLSVEGVSEEDRKKDTICMSVLNTFACLVAQAEKSCGRDASNTIQEILIKVKLLKWLNCNEAHMQELKTKLLKSRTLGEERKEIFSTFF